MLLTLALYVLIWPSVVRTAVSVGNTQLFPIFSPFLSSVVGLGCAVAQNKDSVHTSRYANDNALAFALFIEMNE